MVVVKGQDTVEATYMDYIFKHNYFWQKVLKKFTEQNCREGEVMNKGVKNRMMKPTETADLKKGELMDHRQIAGKPA